MLASHKHSDHLDPGTMPELLAASPAAVLVLPESILDHASELGLPRNSCWESTPATRWKRAGFRVHADSLGPRGARHRRQRTSSLPGVRDRVRGAQALS